MADETAYIAPSSLLDHCHMLGAQHNPSNFSSSVPGGVWAAAANPRRSPAGGEDKEGAGVPIFRVDHQMNGDGMIFTPVDHGLLNREGRTSSGCGMPMTVPESEEEYMASQSLSDFCRDLGERHDPTQFGTSVPGGCWTNSIDRASAPPGAGGGGLGESVGKENKMGGIPILSRVEHKMNGDGMIFTPSQSTFAAAMVVGSVESDSDVSWRGSPAATSPALNLFDQPRLRNTALLLPAGSPPVWPPSVGQQLAQEPTTLAEALHHHVEDPLRRITEEESPRHAPPSPEAPSKASTPAASPKPSPKLAPMGGDLQGTEGNSPDSSGSGGAMAVMPRPGVIRPVNKAKIGEEETCKARPRCSIM